MRRPRDVRPVLFALLALAPLVVPARDARAQDQEYYEQIALPARHNWLFRERHPSADRLFNAFDYGHAVLSEVLYTRLAAAPDRLERREFEFITRELLVRPPRVPLAERPIAPAFARLAPEVLAMFEWAHILHRQLYDVLADASLTPERRDAEVARILAYYRSRPDLAFSSQPKHMDLMEGQPYSLAFRDGYPKFNGLIWSYHWLQMALYDALLAGEDAAAGGASGAAMSDSTRDAEVRATVARFRRMVDDGAMPAVMPMSAAIAPAFSARYPEASIIFDNLHAMHDVVSDVLASPVVPRADKRRALLLAASRYRDSTSFVTTVAEWRAMSSAMGVERMGGVAGRAAVVGAGAGHGHGHGHHR